MHRSIHRRSDNLARWGGDEFAVGLPQSSLEDSARIASELLKEFANDPRLEFPPTKEFPGFRVRASIGVAEVDMDLFRRSPEQAFTRVLHQADEAMYAAKRSGRNAVAIYMPKKPRKARFVIYKPEVTQVEASKDILLPE